MARRRVPRGARHLREFEAQACIRCETDSPYDPRVRALLAQLGIALPNGDRRFILSTTDTFANEDVPGRLREFLAGQQRCRSGVLWNYTAGTKPMAIAIDRHLGPGMDASPVKAMFCIDTRQPRPLFIDGHDALLRLSTRLDVAELIQANGWKVLGALRITGPLDAPLDRGLHVRELRSWVRQKAQTGGVIETIGRFEHIETGQRDDFTPRLQTLSA